MSSFRLAAVCCLLIWLAQGSYAQSILEGAAPGSVPILPQSTWAEFESMDPQGGLSCTVVGQKPVLGLDLKFHSGYQVFLPVQELDSSGDVLTVLFRIIPDNRPNHAVYFKERFVIPAIEEHATGNAAFPGHFDLGSGSYRVELLIHDRVQRMCSASWEVTASPSAKDRSMQLALGAGDIRAAQQDVFLRESMAHKAENGALRIKVLVNFVPPTPSAAALDRSDTEAVVSILRNIGRDPRVGLISLVAFNLYEERVIFRQENGEGIDFPALGKSLSKLNPGTVAVDQLLRKHGPADFLATLVRDETGSGGTPDALVFVGPRAYVEGSVGTEEKKQSRELGCPVFYLNYVNNPQGTPWKDSIGRLVKSLHGYEFSITAPRDLWNAVTDTVSRIFDWWSPSIAGQARESH